MRETKAERAVRQDWERTQLVDVLRRAGNRVDEEMTVPGSEYVVDVTVLTPDNRCYAVEINGVGYSHFGRKGVMRDWSKACAIAAAGWVYLPVTWQQVRDGDALELLARCGVCVELTGDCAELDTNAERGGK